MKPAGLAPARLLRSATQAAEAAYRRWPGLTRSPAGAPLRVLLSRVLVGSGLFDAYAYSAAAGLRFRSREAAADHYLRRGAARGLTPQPAFDCELYARASGLRPEDDAFVHYALAGRFRRPPPPLNGGFDADDYARRNPDLRLARLEILRHYLERGRIDRAETTPPEPVVAPPDWSRRPPRAEAAGSAVDVVVPVYRGRAETLACVTSVLSAAGETPFRLVVIDDASPEPELSRDLRAGGEAGAFVYLQNAENLGFTRTVNRGMAMAEGRDVVLLNADAEVYDRWLDRLRAVAYARPDTGTVTPMSNAATILSYPVWLKDNATPLEAGPGALDAMLEQLAPDPVEIPTAIGFCMYIRSDCLAATGLFDADAFPRGYGEENDFCMRAAALGWRHLAATGVFVHHHGSRSFGAERAALGAAAMRVILNRYPDYQQKISAFIATDALAPVRRALDIARIRAAAPAARLVHEAVTAAAAGDVVTLRRVGGRRPRFILSCPAAPATPNLPALDPLGDPAAAAALLRALGVRSLRLEDDGLAGRRAAAALRAAATAAGAAVEAGARA